VTTRHFGSRERPQLEPRAEAGIPEGAEGAGIPEGAEEEGGEGAGIPEGAGEGRAEGAGIPEGVEEESAVCGGTALSSSLELW